MSALRRRVAAASVLLVLSVPLGAQETAPTPPNDPKAGGEVVRDAPREPVEVKADSGVVDGSFLQPYTNRWTMFAVTATGSKHRVGTWSDELKLEDREGKRGGVRTQVIDQGPFKRTLINKFETLGMIPLEPGYAATFPYYDASDPMGPASGRRALRVTGTEAVAAGARGDVDAFLVVTDQGWKFWLTKDAPYIIRLEVADPSGGTMLWEMDEES